MRTELGCKPTNGHVYGDGITYSMTSKIGIYFLINEDRTSEDDDFNQPIWGADQYL